MDLGLFCDELVKELQPHFPTLITAGPGGGNSICLYYKSGPADKIPATYNNIRVIAVKCGAARPS